jgi:glycosyltransferase involved in cell wall biosynthesis
MLNYEYNANQMEAINDKISIIVPVYNAEKYLEKCVNSIINQTHTNIEIILVNDGSTDGSGILCDKYIHDKRVKIIHQKNQGASMSRNNGIDIATGNYIGFVDSDDWIDNDMFEILYKNIANFDADISMCGFKHVDEDGKTIAKSNSLKNSLKIIKGADIIKHNLLDYDEQERINEGVWNKLYKHSLFNNIRFPLGKIQEDTFTTYRILENAQNMVISSEIKYNYLQRHDSITQPLSPRIFDIIEANVERYEYIKLVHFNFEPLCRKILLLNIIGVLFKISKSKINEINKEDINKMLNIVQTLDIYTCGISKDYIELLELFLKNSRTLLITMKLSQ